MAEPHRSYLTCLGIGLLLAVGLALFTWSLGGEMESEKVMELVNGETKVCHRGDTR